jgi:hypothetical protein
MLIVTAVITLVSSSAFSQQWSGTPTPFPRRSAPSLPPLGLATVFVTITLIDPPVSVVVAEANAAARSDLEIFALATLQWLRIASAQDQLIQILTQPPYNAELIDRWFRDHNSVSVVVRADRVQPIQTLPGVLSVRVGGSTMPPVPTQELPLRPDFQPGTRLPPLQPPGYN